MNPIRPSSLDLMRTRARLDSRQSLLLADSPLRACLRMACGLVFLTFGMTKAVDCIALGTTLVQLPEGPRGFAMYLAAVGVPFPLLNAYFVLAVEIGCSLGLLTGMFFRMSRHITRLFALMLSGDMAVAMGLVGVRNLLHQPVMIDGVAVTEQLWRFPLELSLLLCSLYFVLRPLARSMRQQAHGMRAP